ncbi:MAG: hypothetical protein FWD95_01860 [Nocardioidaceae bacterium]|nr:hypothetical protein [Nocardioidaceae bacterium]
MARGGARNRSGPTADPNSGRSDRRGYSLTALPAEGYDGDVPDFPLSKRSVYSKEWNEAGKQVLVYDAAETERVAEREQDFWAWLWTTPQACAWSMPSEGWRMPAIALYTRTFVICESGEATAADKGSLHRFADQIGMTTAGLAEMGWRVAVDETAEKRSSKAEETVPAAKSSRDRMKVVTGSGG